MSQNKQLTIDLDPGREEAAPVAAGNIFIGSISRLRDRPYIPFYSLLLNENLCFPFPDGGITGNTFPAEVLLRSRIHPAFIAARRAELAIRRNELEQLKPENLLKGMDERFLPLFLNLGLEERRFQDDLLLLAIIYNNSEAVRLLAIEYDLDLDYPLTVAIDEQRHALVHLLLTMGAPISGKLNHALQAEHPDLLLVKVLLHHEADIKEKDCVTGNDALAFARKTSRRVRAQIVGLIKAEQGKLSAEEVDELEASQVPDFKYSTQYLHEQGKLVLENLGNPDIQLEKAIRYLIGEASPDAYNYIAEAFLKTRSPNTTTVSNANALRSSLLHLNFLIPENRENLVKIGRYVSRVDAFRLVNLFRYFDAYEAKSDRRSLLSVKTNTNDSIFKYSFFDERLAVRYPDMVGERLKVETILDGNNLDTSCWRPIDYCLPMDSRNLSYQLNVNKDWLSRLRMLRCGLDDGTRLSDDQIRDFTAFLIKSQRNDTEPDMKTGSWAIPTEVNMPGDARIDFVYMPTYLAVAWLYLIQQEYPQVAENIGGFLKTLRDGLRFASLRGLSGNGYDAVAEMVVAVKILSIGRVFSATSENNKMSISFTKAVEKAKQDLKENIAIDSTDESWSKIDENEARLALQLIDGGDCDDKLVCMQEVALTSG